MTLFPSGICPIFPGIWLIIPGLIWYLPNCSIYAFALGLVRYLPKYFRNFLVSTKLFRRHSNCSGIAPVSTQLFRDRSTIYQKVPELLSVYQIIFGSFSYQIVPKLWWYLPNYSEIAQLSIILFRDRSVLYQIVANRSGISKLFRVYRTKPGLFC